MNLAMEVPVKFSKYKLDILPMTFMQLGSWSKRIIKPWKKLDVKLLLCSFVNLQI